MLKYVLFILFGFILVFPNVADAHPGRTDSSGGHTCYTNCAKWGLSTGQYHYHNSKSNSNSSNNSQNNSSNSAGGQTTTNTAPNPSVSETPVYSQPQKSYKIPASKSEVTVNDYRPKNKALINVKESFPDMNKTQENGDLSSNAPPISAISEDTGLKQIETKEPKNHSWILLVLAFVSVGVIFLSKK